MQTVVVYNKLTTVVDLVVTMIYSHVSKDEDILYRAMFDAAALQRSQ